MKARAALATTVLIALLAVPWPAGATTYARTCGKTTMDGHKIVIRTHLLSCSKGKPYALTYIRRHKAPAGWKCTDYAEDEGSVAFTCRRRNRSFLGIRR